MQFAPFAGLPSSRFQPTPPPGSGGYIACELHRSFARLDSPGTWVAAPEPGHSPPGFGGHPEDIIRPMLIGIFRICALAHLLLELSVPLLEGVGDVLQEYETQDDVFVLCGVHVVAELIGGCP